MLITRPRIASSTSTWMRPLDAAIMYRYAHPTAASSARPAANAGATANATSRAPSTTIDVATPRRPTRFPPRPTAKAPTTEPRPIAAPSAPYAPAPSPYTSEAKTGRMAWAGPAKNDTTAMAATSERMIGDRRT